jgi:hypothetical protein
MSRGKKICPKCKTECGVRTKICQKCKYDFARTPQKVNNKTNRRRKKKTDTPSGTWVYDLPPGMPKIQKPQPLPDGPVDNIVLYEYCVYNGFGNAIFEEIPNHKIADHVLRKKWQKAHDAMHEAWTYLTKYLEKAFNNE